MVKGMGGGEKRAMGRKEGEGMRKEGEGRG